jgi:pyruvate dehydrogenase E1 component alpha subunit
VVPSYRESALLLARGLPIHVLILYWRAHPAGWRFPEEVRAVNPYIPIATQIPQAVGLALAGRYRGEDWVVATSIGDGGTSEGDFHEGLNFAAVFDAPVLFLVQNNGYAISVPRSRQMRVDFIARRAEGYGIPGVVVDGNDAEAVYAVTVEARARALAGAGPSLIECKTYRWRGHGEADHQLYQPREEILAWQRRCPLALLQERLLADGLLDQAAVAILEAEVAATVQAAIRFAEDSPYPEPPEALEDVFA